MNEPLTLHVFTDPTCPFAYSAEPTRWRLKWLYGDQLNWRNTMIVLSGYQDETSKLKPEMIARSYGRLREQHGMPIDDQVRPRLPETILASRNYVAVRRHSPLQADALLRNLQIAAMSGKLIDEQAVIDEAAVQAGLDIAQVAAWVQEPETETELNADAEAARTSTPVTLGFRRKISQTSTGRVRYSAPSYQFIEASKLQFELPGFWPLEAYEGALGNIAPALQRADNPKSVTEVLKWADMPLATVEVATICAQPQAKVRAELEKVATFTPIGQDGIWTLKQQQAERTL